MLLIISNTYYSYEEKSFTVFSRICEVLEVSLFKLVINIHFLFLVIKNYLAHRLVFGGESYNTLKKKLRKKKK